MEEKLEVSMDDVEEVEDTYEEITPKEKQIIISNFLKSSPPGEIKEILEDIKTICGEDYNSILDRSFLETVFREYNTESLQVVTSEDEKQKLVLSKNTETESGAYIDGKSGKAFTVNHIEQVIKPIERKGEKENFKQGEDKEQDEENEEAGDQKNVLVDDKEEVEVERDEKEETEVEQGDQKGETDAKGSPQINTYEAQRSAVEKELATYLKSQYHEGKAVQNVVAMKNKLVILISAERENKRNYWTGRWMSSFEYDFANQSLFGTIRIRVHYYEDGNVQMTTNKDCNETILPSTNSPENLARLLAKKIIEFENAVQASLEEMYLSMSHETFKDMRRILPISKQRMDWSGAQMTLAKGVVKKQ